MPRRNERSRVIDIAPTIPSSADGRFHDGFRFFVQISRAAEEYALVFGQTLDLGMTSRALSYSSEAPDNTSETHKLMMIRPEFLSGTHLRLNPWSLA